MGGRVVAARFLPREAVFGRDGARVRATRTQYACALVLCLLAAWGWRDGPAGPVHVAHLAARGFFCGVIVMRLAALAVARPPPEPQPVADADLPFYSVILPLFREAEVAPSLARRLRAIDYPADRIEFLFALEPEDRDTRRAVERERLPGAQIVLSAPGGPQTKPHACNSALAQARGDLVVVYDAEDRPHPLQLREAAARFAAGPDDLACLQAPLRIVPDRAFLKRQFALEYAVPFETLLPAFARAGMPFPLGGTSNHFRVATLRGLGGWDAYNVTEDADIGLRLCACGGRLGLLSRPTHEPAPGSLEVWTPQRTRWIKGHMQTWIVHIRHPFRGGWRSFVALQLTLGVNTVTSLTHGFLAVSVLACLLIAVTSRAAPAIAPPDVALLLGGWLSAALAMRVGARRAGLPVRPGDYLLAVAYWPLQSLAGLFALLELATRPHHWNKTHHEAEPEEQAEALPVAA